MTLDAAPRDYADPALHAQGLWIGGQWLPGGGIPVINPSTGRRSPRSPDAGLAEAMAAVDAAEAAAAGWRATPPRQRSEILRRMFTRMTEEAEALAHLISLENGKALSDARGEVAYAAEFFRWNAEEATRIPGEFRHTPSGSHNILVDHEPIGISVLITPWNFPAAMATRKIGPALAAGCTVILKPASETPADRLCDGPSGRGGGRACRRDQRADHHPARARHRCHAGRSHGCESCPSPDRPGSAALFWPRPRRPWSVARWNLAATRPSSSLTMPI